tara:strand:+ start:720 stop:938 length:219 start_codon:yes stop_codon:yes gene_type:complete
MSNIILREIKLDTDEIIDRSPTNKELQEFEKNELDRLERLKAIKNQIKNKKSATDKLASLGLTQAEVLALLG